MKRNKRVTALILSFVLAFTLMPWPNTVGVEASSKLKLAKKSATIYVGKTTKIKVKISRQGQN